MRGFLLRWTHSIVTLARCGRGAYVLFRDRRTGDGLTRRASQRNMRAVSRVVVLLLLPCACAGSGKSYPCDPNLGNCGGVGLPDGGVWTPFAVLPGTDGLAAWRPKLYGSQLLLSIWNADELFANNQPTGFSLLATPDCALFAPATAPAAGPGAREGDIVVRAGGEP